MRRGGRHGAMSASPTTLTARLSGDDTGAIRDGSTAPVAS